MDMKIWRHVENINRETKNYVPYIIVSYLKYYHNVIHKATRISSTYFIRFTFQLWVRGGIAQYVQRFPTPWKYNFIWDLMECTTTFISPNSLLSMSSCCTMKLNLNTFPKEILCKEPMHKKPIITEYFLNLHIIAWES